MKIISVERPVDHKDDPYIIVTTSNGNRVRVPEELNNATDEQVIAYYKSLN